MLPDLLPDRGLIHVVGAGLVGALTTIGLARLGYRVALFDRRADPATSARERGRSVNVVVSARGWRALEGIGLADEVRALCTPLIGRCIHLWRGDRLEQAYGRQGEQIWCIERSLLHDFLSARAACEPGVRLHWGYRLRSVELERGLLGFQVEGASETSLTRIPFERACGVDGAFSAMRGALFEETFDFQQQWLEVAYKELRLPSRADGGPELDPGRFQVWPRGRLFLGAFPNQDGTFTGSLFLPRTGFPSFETVTSEADFAALVSTFFPDLEPWLGTLWPQYRDNPASPMVTIRCRPWSWGGRFVLLGDAAHALVPFLGQGMNCGFEDARALCRCLDEHGHDWTDALVAFERERRPNADALAALSLAHYKHLNHVPHPSDEARERLGLLLDEIAPERFRPLYELVAFTDIPYAAAERLEALRCETIDRILEDPAFDGPWPSDAEDRVRRALQARRG